MNYEKTDHQRIDFKSVTVDLDLYSCYQAGSDYFKVISSPIPLDFQVMSDILHIGAPNWKDWMDRVEHSQLIQVPVDSGDIIHCLLDIALPVVKDRDVALKVELHECDSNFLLTYEGVDYMPRKKFVRLPEMQGKFSCEPTGEFHEGKALVHFIYEGHMKLGGTVGRFVPASFVAETHFKSLIELLALMDKR